MKRVISMLLIFLLAVSAGAEAGFSTFDYYTGQSGGDRYLYFDFPDVSLDLPMAWKDKLTVEKTDSGVCFYQTASLEKYREEGIPGGGFLFELCASADESFRQLPAYADLGYSDNAGLYFYLRLPSDDPAYPDEAIRAEYTEMAAQIDAVVEMARIRPSMQFYPPTEVLDGNDLA